MRRWRDQVGRQTRARRDGVLNAITDIVEFGPLQVEEERKGWASSPRLHSSPTAR